MAVDVTDESFEKVVLGAAVPVLADFWAEWCGPCRVLGPVLDQIEQEYEGRFLLAKIDTETARRTAGAFMVQSIPAVKLFVGGKVVDEFTGAFPAEQVRRFLDKNLPDPALAELLDQTTDPIERARNVLAKGLTGNEADALLWVGALGLLGNRGEEPEAIEALKMLQGITALGGDYSQRREALLQVAESAGPEAVVDLVPLLGTEEECRKTLEGLLGAVQESKGDEREHARRQLLAGFQLLGPATAIVNEFRRKLSSVLF